MDSLKRKYETSGVGRGNLDPSTLKLVYEQTSEASRLRHAVIAICVWDMQYEHFAKHRANFPADFKDDYAMQQAKRINGKSDSKMPLTVRTTFALSYEFTLWL